MIKVAFVIDTIESPTAGTEKQLLLLIENLDRREFSPVLCVLYSSDWLSSEFRSCPLYVIGARSFKTPGMYASIFRFRNFLKKEGVSIVQTHFRDSNIVGILAARLAGIKAVISSRRNQGYWYTPTEIRLLKILNRWVSLFVANAESTKEWAVRTESIPREKIEVIYNGLDLDKFRSLISDAKKRSRECLNINPVAPVVGIVANLRPVKGVDVFLRAAALVKKDLPGAIFVSIGDGGERSKLEALSEELGIADSVRFLGKRLDIASILPAFDVAVLSSRSESFSNAVVEYMAAGLPVVCTDVGGCREAVGDGINGFVVPVGDYAAMGASIATILKDGLQGEMGTISRKRANDLFGLDSMISKFERMFDRLAGDTHKPVSG
ncbi:MAG: glycosyltransferase [Nitrospirota bacterium]|nr:glycosyltransferase [Nitrospirota bacterium]